MSQGDDVYGRLVIIDGVGDVKIDLMTGVGDMVNGIIEAGSVTP